MRLAPYGEPTYVDLILKNLIDIKDDGTFKLDMSYFNYAVGLTMTNEKFNKIFGGPPCKSESPLTQKHMDLARSIQVVTEEIVLRLARGIRNELVKKYLCLAGGVALNCVTNGRLLREGPFDDIWIQPAAGGALCAALSVWHEYLGHGKSALESSKDHMRGTCLGPQYSRQAIIDFLKPLKAPAEEVPDNLLFDRVAGLLEEGNVVGWFEGTDGVWT